MQTVVHLTMQTKQIGIVGLGWLGYDLGLSLDQLGYSVWGTVRSNAKRDELLEKTNFPILPWSYPEVFGEKMLPLLQETDVLIITLPPSGFENDNYEKCIEALIQVCSDTTKIIFTSSIGVYKQEEKVDEESKVDPTTPLAKAEAVVQTNARSDWTILRLGGLIGEDRNPVHYLVKKELNLDAEKPVQLIHKKDILKIVERILEKNEFPGILNLVHPDRPTRKIYYSTQAKQLALPEPQFATNEPGKTYKEVNCSKLVAGFGFKEFEPLLRKTR